VRTFHRYVAIGDSSTEGLEDLDEHGAYRGWADRLAQYIADSQDVPLEYANLAVRGRRMGEIRATQLEAAVALRPDLMTVFGGVNDVLLRTRRFGAIQADLGAMFAAGRDLGATVLSFTVPDPAMVNPLVRRMQGPILALNEMIRAEADRHGVLVIDFAAVPLAADRRLYWADRLHSSPLGHEVIATAIAARLELPGFGDWTELVPADPERVRLVDRIWDDLGWVRRHVLPFALQRARGIRYGTGREPKRPTPSIMPKGSVRTG
jgi:lysophospholipase L1-like esterase